MKCNQMLFVYGTLRSGLSNHGLLKNTTAVALQAAVKGELFDTGRGFPALISGDMTVYGELYKVSDEQLISIDLLEGYYGLNDNRNLYDRVDISVTTDLGTMNAQTYIYAESSSFQLLIENGDWKVYRFLLQHADQEKYYMAYGSCMDTVRFEMHQVGHLFEKVVGRACCSGYQLAFTKRSVDGGRADMVEIEGEGAIEGKLYLISDEALSYLYDREGVTYGTYRPAVIAVKMEDGSTLEALTFLVVNKQEETVPPRHYIEEILRGAKPIVSDSYYAFLFDTFVYKFGYRTEVE